MSLKLDREHPYTIGVVVLNFNSSEETTALIKQLDSYASVDAIQVIDNHSCDDSLKDISAFVEKFGLSKTRLAEMDKNSGYAVGNNYGVHLLDQWISPDIIAIANPDIQISEYNFNKTIECMVIHGASAVSPKMLDFGAEASIQAWHLPSKTTNLFSAFFLLVALFGSPLSYSKSDLIGSFLNVEALPGSLIFFRTSAFLKVNGYDEDTFLFCEEDILFSKFQKEGLRSILCLKTTYNHMHSAVISREYKSLFSRYMLLLDSKRVYNKKILKTSMLYNGIYEFCFFLNAWIMSMAIWLKIRLNKGR